MPTNSRCRAGFLANVFAAMRPISQLLGLLVILSSACPTPLWAQNARPGVPEPKREPIRAAGTIKGAANGIMQVTTAAGDQYLVKLDPNIKPTNPTQITFSGKADPSFLRPGLLVRFTAKFDKRGRAVEPIELLDIVTQRDGMQLGFTPDGGISTASSGLFQEAKPEKPAKQTKKAPPPDNISAVVIGPLTEAKNGKLTINVGGKQLKAELAENAKIHFDFGDLSLIKPGDKIEFQGFTYAGVKQQVVANHVTIIAAEPLKIERKKGPASSEPAADREKNGDKGTDKGTDKGAEKGSEKGAEKSNEKKSSVD
jgi:hypothetical protein